MAKEKQVKVLMAKAGVDGHWRGTSADSFSFPAIPTEVRI